MINISINLLPKEILLQRQQNTKLRFLTVLSMGLLILLIFLSSATLAMRIAQNLEFRKASDNVVYAQEREASLKSKEAQLVFLKERLSLIDSFSQKDKKIKEMFNLVLNLIPLDIQISELSVDKTGNMVILLSTNNLFSLEKMTEDLGNKEKNSNLIKKISMEGLTRGKDGIFRFSLKITN